MADVLDQIIGQENAKYDGYVRTASDEQIESDLRGGIVVPHMVALALLRQRRDDRRNVRAIVRANVYRLMALADGFEQLVSMGIEPVGEPPIVVPHDGPPRVRIADSNISVDLADEWTGSLSGAAS